VTVTRVKAVKGGEKKINPLTKTEYITKDKPAHTSPHQPDQGAQGGAE